MCMHKKHVKSQDYSSNSILKPYLEPPTREGGGKGGREEGREGVRE